MPTISQQFSLTIFFFWLIHWCIAVVIAAGMASLLYGWLAFFAFPFAAAVVFLAGLSPAVLASVFYEGGKRKINPYVYGVIGALSSILTVTALLIDTDGGVRGFIGVSALYDLLKDQNFRVTEAIFYLWLSLSGYVGGFVFGLLRLSRQKKFQRL